MEEAQDPAEWVQLSCKKETLWQSSGAPFSSLSTMLFPPRERPAHPASNVFLLTKSWAARITSPLPLAVERCQGVGGSGSPAPCEGEEKALLLLLQGGQCARFTRVPVPTSNLLSESTTTAATCATSILPSCEISWETPGAATVSKSAATPGFQQPHGSPTSPCRLASVQHLLREVSQLSLLLHGPQGLPAAGWALLLAQGSGRPPRPPAPCGRAGALLQLRALLLVVLGIAGKRLAAAQVFLLHRAAHILFAWPRGRGTLLGVLAKVDNNDVALEVHYLSA